MAARTPTPRQKQDNEALILYRLTAVEVAVKEVDNKLARMDNIKKADLHELQNAIFDRILEVKSDLQKQINDKADKSDVENLSDTLKWAMGIGGTVIAGVLVILLTRTL